MARPRENDPEWQTRNITTSIPYAWWKTCKQRKWSWQHVFRSGFMVLEHEGKLPERIKALENELEAHKRWKTKVERLIPRHVWDKE